MVSEARRIGRGQTWAPFLGIGLFALVVRLVYLWEIQDAPMFSMLLGDAQSYDAWARQTADGDWIGQTVFYQAPLYPYFLALLYWIWGNGLWTVKLVQIFLGAGSCVLLALTARHWFSNRTALVCGVLAALYPPAIFFDGLIQKSVLDIFLLSALLYVLGRWRKMPRPGSSLVAGLLAGFLALTRENALIFPPIILLWHFVSTWHHPWRQRLVPTGLFVIGLAVLLLPVSLRNLTIGGSFHLTTSQLGPNFYIGNHEGADGTYAPLRWGRGKASFERTDAKSLAEEVLGRTLNPAEVSKYWSSRAVDQIRSDPGRWLKLIGHKCWLIINHVEIADTEDQYSYSEWSILLTTLGHVLHLGVILPLAVAGLFITRSRGRELWLLYVMLLAYVLSVVLFYVFARYRLPMICFMLPFASCALVEGRQWIQTSKPPIVGLCLTATIGLAVLANWPLLTKDDYRAVTHNNIGTYLTERNGVEAAKEHYDRALQYKPDYAAAHYNLGTVLAKLGQNHRAINHLQQAANLQPNYAETYHQLGIVLAKQGAINEATGQYQRALKLAPNHTGARNNLGVCLAARGQLGEASRHLTHVLKIDPNHSKAHNNLGIVLARSGQLEKAIEHFQSALRTDRDYGDARENLGRALTLTGQHAKAVGHYTKLAEFYEATGQLDEAVRTWQKALESALKSGDDEKPRAIRQRLERAKGKARH